MIKIQYQVQFSRSVEYAVCFSGSLVKVWSWLAQGDCLPFSSYEITKKKKLSLRLKKEKKMLFFSNQKMQCIQFIVLGFNTTLTASDIMAVGDAHVFPGFLTPVVT